MIKMDSTDVISELDSYIEEVERKLKRMVEGFAYEIALTASGKTPIGDPENATANYLEKYKQRYNDYKIPIEGGYHKGAWQYSSNGTFIFNPKVTGEGSGFDAANNTEESARANYKIGSTFYIGAVGPGYADLENNSSVQTNGAGIMKPTINAITLSYKVDLKRYFDQG